MPSSHLDATAADVLSGTARWSLHHGDGFALGRTLPDRSVVVIGDPPYDAKTHANAKSMAGGKVHNHAIEFAAITDASFVPDLLRVTKSWVLCFCALEQLAMYRDAAGDSWIRSGVWHRPDGSPQFTGDRPAQACEGIAIMHFDKGKTEWNGGGGRAHWSYGVERKDRVHETQKPLPLMLELVRLFTDPDDIVFDPTCGSGTSCVAALLLNRRFIGAEINADKAATARERIIATAAESTITASRAGQMALFA